MFLRAKVRKRDGKQHRYFSVAEKDGLRAGDKRRQQKITLLPPSHRSAENLPLCSSRSWNNWVRLVAASATIRPVASSDIGA
jgi:hypothetical protein